MLLNTLEPRLIKATSTGIMTINSPIVSALAAIEFDISPITVETAVMILVTASDNDGSDGDGVGGDINSWNVIVTLPVGEPTILAGLHAI